MSAPSEEANFSEYSFGAYHLTVLNSLDERERIKMFFDDTIWRGGHQTWVEVLIKINTCRSNYHNRDWANDLRGNDGKE